MNTPEFPVEEPKTQQEQEVAPILTPRKGNYRVIWITCAIVFVFLLIITASIFFLVRSKRNVKQPYQQLIALSTIKPLGVLPISTAELTPTNQAASTNVNVISEQSVGTTEAADTFIGKFPDYIFDLTRLHPENYAGVDQKTLYEIKGVEEDPQKLDYKILKIGQDNIEIKLLASYENDQNYNYQVCLPNKLQCFSADSHTLISINGRQVELAYEDIKEIKFNSGLALYITAEPESEYNPQGKAFFSESTIQIKKR